MNYQSELEFAVLLAREAGEIMKRYFRAADIGTQWKADHTPLTLADTQINDLVIERVRAAFPTYGVHGEEASMHKDRDYLWICDPVDGTMPFSLGLPLSTFSIGLVFKGKPVVGVVYDPFGDRLYQAVVGGGATMNGHTLAVSEHTLAGSYLDLEMIPGALGTVEVGDIRTALFARQVLPFTLFSFITAGMMVASGEFSAAIFCFTKPEDLAAVKVIVEEAGGRVTDLAGNDQAYHRQLNGALVTNGVAHEELVQLIADAKTPE